MTTTRVCTIFAVCVSAVYCLFVLHDTLFVASDPEAAEGRSGKGITKPSVVAAPKEVSPLLPAFADRAKVPASGKQGPPGKASKMIGNWKKGEALFVRYCQSCHGPEGTDKVPNPGSDDRTVPPLNPVDPALLDKKAPVFAEKIDRFIQHGSLPDGKSPALFMPDWGDSKTLSQREVASVEAYIIHLNGVFWKR